MLTSSANQYLRPEYLTPLPTTLDAKKSPLALLAQTCSQIGVDPPSGKSLLTFHDKSSSRSSKSSSDSVSSREKSSPSSGFHSSRTSASPKFSSSSSESTKSSSFKPYESCVTDSSNKSSSSPENQRVSSVQSNSGRSRTPGNKRCSSNQSASSGGRAMTPQGRKSSTPNHNESNTPRASPSARINVVSDLTTPRSRSSSSPTSAKPTSYSPAAHVSQDLFRPSPISSLMSTSTSTGATTTTTPSPAAYGLPYPPQMQPMDPMGSLMSQHHAAAAAAAMKNGLAHHPYLSYARMKTPSGAETLVPVCRDPYCTGCQLNSHLLAATSQASAVNGSKIPTTQSGSAACPAGCAQCDHKPNAAAAAAAAAHAAASSPYAAYAHAQLVALAAASQVPYVCNWIGGDATYCGKRFSTSDELLQHFRNHAAAGSAPGDSSAAAAAATTAAALSLLSPPGLAPGHPLLSRSYPTPPLSPLATARYHPYSKPHYGAPGLSSLGLPLPPPHHAGLPPYFSPYSLYAGSRLGAASGMHP